MKKIQTYVLPSSFYPKKISINDSLDYAFRSREHFGSIRV